MCVCVFLPVLHSVNSSVLSDVHLRTFKYYIKINDWNASLTNYFDQFCISPSNAYGEGEPHKYSAWEGEQHVTNCDMINTVCLAHRETQTPAKSLHKQVRSELVWYMHV